MNRKIWMAPFAFKIFTWGMSKQCSGNQLPFWREKSYIEKRYFSMMILKYSKIIQNTVYLQCFRNVTYNLPLQVHKSYVCFYFKPQHMPKQIVNCWQKIIITTSKFGNYFKNAIDFYSFFMQILIDILINYLFLKCNFTYWISSYWKLKILP